MVCEHSVGIVFTGKWRPRHFKVLAQGQRLGEAGGLGLHHCGNFLIWFPCFILSSHCHVCIYCAHVPVCLCAHECMSVWLPVHCCVCTWTLECTSVCIWRCARALVCVLGFVCPCVCMCAYMCIHAHVPLACMNLCARSAYICMLVCALYMPLLVHVCMHAHMCLQVHMGV